MSGWPMTIDGRAIGPSYPPYVIAELSANHNGDIERAFAVMEAAHDAGAEVVKLQTYTPDTMTIDCDRPEFQVRGGLWDGNELYGKAETPWDWHPALLRQGAGAGTQRVQHALLRDRRGGSGRARRGLRATDAAAHCISGYPTRPQETNLRTIADLRCRFGVQVGLSDHTLGTAVATAAVALGATVVEKHVTLRRADGGPDSAFSLEPEELTKPVSDVRDAWAAFGDVNYVRTESEERSLVFRRSIFTVADIAEGEVLTNGNVRIIRPGHGLAPKHLPAVLGRRAARRIPRGTPIDWALLQTPKCEHV